MTVKPWYQSKTIWFNIGMAVLTLVAAGLESFKPFMGPQVYASVSLFVGVVNVILRTITTTGLTTDKE